MTSPAPAYAALDVTVATTIHAPATRVWRALTDETARWWPRDFYTGAEPRAFVLEPALGGHMKEDWGDGQGLVWAVVTGVRHASFLQLSGELTRPFGGPARTITTIRLAEEDGATTVTLTDTVFGSVTAESAAAMEAGWRALLDGSLRPYVETGARPERPPTVVD